MSQALAVCLGMFVQSCAISETDLQVALAIDLTKVPMPAILETYLKYFICNDCGMMPDSVIVITITKVLATVYCTCQGWC